jgi:uncharacterized protein (TIGR03118 family)
LQVESRWYVFVAYAKTKAAADNPAEFEAGEEDAIEAGNESNRPNRGKVVMYDLDGHLIQIFDDRRMNAPWGLAIAPDGFGNLSGKLLVGNFGGRGRIAAFTIGNGLFFDWLRDEKDSPIGIPGLWGLQFGNGESLGDGDALYFAAGPQEETQGLFGALRVAPVHVKHPRQAR